MRFNRFCLVVVISFVLVTTLTLPSYATDTGQLEIIGQAIEKSYNTRDISILKAVIAPRSVQSMDTTLTHFQFSFEYSRGKIQLMNPVFESKGHNYGQYDFIHKIKRQGKEIVTAIGNIKVYLDRASIRPQIIDMKVDITKEPLKESEARAQGGSSDKDQ